MEQKINEELRQYKLFKIQETESKLRKFTSVYEEIKQHFVVKFSKNASSNLVRIALGVLVLLFFVLGIACFFPDAIIDFVQTNNLPYTQSEIIQMRQELNIFKYIFLGLAVFFWFIGVLLRKNNKKRNTIHSLSKLLEEVMDYMETSSAEEKRKYEYFVDSLAEKEQIKKATKAETD